MRISFHKKRVIVTGATRGIGKRIAEDLYALGATLLLTGTDPDQIRDMNNRLKRNASVRYCHLDFLDEESVKNFVTLVKGYKKIDVLINNAGINRINYIYDTSLNDWDDITKVNLRGPFILSREVGNMMKENNYGRIVNIASLFGVVTKQKRAAYTATKAALIGLTKTAAIDMAPYNVLVNAVSPGFVMTDLTKRILTIKDRKAIKASIPLGRFGTSEEISRMVLFVASDLNTYMTGQNIIVDGGYVDI